MVTNSEVLVCMFWFKHCWINLKYAYTFVTYPELTHKDIDRITERLEMYTVLGNNQGKKFSFSTGMNLLTNWIYKKQPLPQTGWSLFKDQPFLTANCHLPFISSLIHFPHSQLIFLMLCPNNITYVYIAWLEVLFGHLILLNIR